MISINVKHSYNINIEGRPSAEIRSLPKPKRVGLIPSATPFIKPKLFVKEGEKVQIGTPLYFDKRCPEVIFVSPGSGTISAIKYGERHRLDEIVIDLDEEETYEKLRKVDAKELSAISRKDMADALVQGGLWPLLEEFPFRNIPNPEKIPPAIYVSIDNDEPFQPQTDVYLKDNIAAFKHGIEALRKLADGSLIIAVSEKSTAPEEIRAMATHRVSGAYPANDPGVVLYHNKKSPQENHSWGIRGNNVVLIGQLLLSGRYPTERMIVLGGPSIEKRMHYKVRLGAAVADVLGDYKADIPVRFISGGILTGRKVSFDSFLALKETALHVLPEGDKEELLPFLKPGLAKPSYSRTFLSALIRNVPLVNTTGLHGGERACIMCGHCPKVCPVDLLPQYIMKSLNAGDIEDAVQHGFLDCVECGLCSYVCPSKIDLENIIKEGKAKLAKEVI